MIYDLNKTSISPSIKSDHSIVNLSFRLKNSIDKGRGFWKFNAALLKENEYIETIQTVIEECKTKYSDLTDKSLLWDIIKCEIRGKTVSYARYRAKERKKKELSLQKKIEFLEHEIEKADNTNENLLSAYNKT